MSTKTSVIFPPSACPNCNHKLSPLDLVPVFSWLFLKGKCRYCQNPISRQYPLVEFFIASIVGFSFYKNGTSLQFIGLASALTIWFIASVIFLRNEVQSFKPFFWALIYNGLLIKLAYPHHITPSNIIILMVFFASIYIATYIAKKEEIHRLAPIFMINLLWLSKIFPLFYTGLAPVTLTFMANNKNFRFIIFAWQILAILLLIFLIN